VVVDETNGQRKSCGDFKKACSELSDTGPNSQKLDAGCIKTNITTGQGKASLNFTLDMPTWRACCRQLCPTMTTHYLPRIQSCPISAKLTSTQEALVFPGNYNPWKIRGSNTGRHSDISIAKFKIAPRDQLNNSIGESQTYWQCSGTPCQAR
jgi:hypothetical protein